MKLIMLFIWSYMLCKEKKKQSRLEKLTSLIAELNHHSKVEGRKIFAHLLKVFYNNHCNSLTLTHGML